MLSEGQRQFAITRQFGNYGAMLFETIGETQLRGQFIDITGTQHDDFTISDTGLPFQI